MGRREKKRTSNSLYFVKTERFNSNTVTEIGSLSDWKTLIFQRCLNKVEKDTYIFFILIYVCLLDHRTFHISLPVCQRVCQCMFVMSKHSCQLPITATAKQSSLIVQKSSRKSTGFHGIPVSGTTHNLNKFSQTLFSSKHIYVTVCVTDRQREIECVCVCGNFS